MRNLLLGILFLVLLTACDNEEQAAHNLKITESLKAENTTLLKEIKLKDEALEKAKLETKLVQEKLHREEEKSKAALTKLQVIKSAKKTEASRNEKLSQVGLQIENNKITIDTDKTKNFFNTLSGLFDGKLKKISADLEKGMIDEKEMGLNIDDSHINIDLNKTKDFLQIWGKKMQSFVKEFDTIAKEFDTK